MSIPKPPFHSAIEELVYEIYLKFTTEMNALKREDIDTLAKLNAIITDAVLVKTENLDSAVQSVKGNVPPIADTLGKIYNIIQSLNFLTAQDIDTLAELNAILSDADLIKEVDLTNAINAVKGNAPANADTLEKLYNIIQGLNYLTAEDIDTLGELNAILSDAQLVKTEDLTDALAALDFNQWRYVDLGDVSGVPVINLAGKAIIKFTQSGSITNFDFTGVTVGRHYIFIIERSANHTFLLKPGRYFLPFGNAIALTDPTTNGTMPAFSRDIVTAICLEPGRLLLIPSHNFLPN
ncbi:MAG: hypothetical protein KF725_03715 [Cyclobacteriaceae bacterium]|jgi:hypothetical protein|nr:hypothetical protein [Cyclobacteriaceae bacterium]MBX2944920.1 hypothetical protein [Cyclobacteriaceae bacterium]MBX2958024.1 hypothetical protein [Cyclobacteriaceae bacterium]HRJ29624.1 hypothetical protein [Cyclobacteriaceae bacterium]HRJ81410.1 hypothetical protein [Cyclobacteriaceae bacterium]